MDREPVSALELAQYARAFEGAPVGIALLRPERDAASVFVEVNEAFAGMFGFSPDEMAGTTVDDVTFHADRTRSRDTAEQLRRGAGIPPLEKRYVRRDGSVFWGVTRASLLRGPGGTPDLIVAHVEDISERKSAAFELLRRHEELEETQRHAQVASFTLHLEPPRLEFSAQMHRMAGWMPRAPSPSFEEFLESIHPDDRSILRDAVTSWQRPAVLQYRFIRSDGRQLMLEAAAAPFVDQEGRPAGVAGTIRDVTEVRALQEGLGEAQRLMAVVAQSPVAHVVACVDDASGSIAYANLAAAALTGRETTSLIGCPLASIVPDRDAVAQIAAEAPAHLTAPVVTADGETIPSDVSTSPVGSDGEGRRVIVAFQVSGSAVGDQRRARARGLALTDREREILQLVAEGRTSADVGAALFVSPETVKTHLGRIFSKLGAHDRASAVATAFRRGELR